MSQGVLVAVEGIDGAGTTTLCRAMADALRGDGQKVHVTRQPSTGPVGKLLREILAGSHQPTDATTLGLLFAADRADHIQREVRPALERGDIVISDRWYYSSLAYQGAGEERRWIRELNRRALVPNLALLVSVSPETAAQRRDGRGEEEIFDAMEMQRQVAANYRDVFAELARIENVATIDGEKTAALVLAESLALVRETCRMAQVG